MNRPKLDIIAVHESFVETEFGYRLSNNMRFANKNLADVDNDTWQELLGNDVNNLNHMPVTYGLARGFVDITNRVGPGHLNDKDTELLLLAAIVHDEAEAIIGDISYGDKTGHDEDLEYEAFKDYINEFHPDYTEEVRDLILKAYKEVVRDSESRLGRMFNAIEKIGYLRTALRAFDNREGGGLPDKLNDSMHYLTIDVLLNIVSSITEYSKDYEPVTYFLNFHSVKITNAFESVGIEDFYYYKPEEQEAKATKFYKAHFDWMMWLSRKK